MGGVEGGRAPAHLQPLAAVMLSWTAGYACCDSRWPHSGAGKLATTPATHLPRTRLLPVQIEAILSGATPKTLGSDADRQNLYNRCLEVTETWHSSTLVNIPTLQAAAEDDYHMWHAPYSLAETAAASGVVPGDLD